MIVVLLDVVIPSSVLFVVGLVEALYTSSVIVSVIFVFPRLGAIGGKVAGWSGPSWIAGFYCFGHTLVCPLSRLRLELMLEVWQLMLDFWQLLELMLCQVWLFVVGAGIVLPGW